MEHTPIGQRNRLGAHGRVVRHISLDVLPDVERLASTEWTDVMTAFKQYAVLQSISDGSAVVLDAGRQLISCQVGACGHFSLLQVNGTIRTTKEHPNVFFVILNGIMKE
jgi:hypothetical protein